MKTGHFLALLILCCVTASDAQTAFNPKIGLLNYTFGDEAHGRHYGQSFGFDVIVEDSRLLFMPGFRYQQYEVNTRSSRSSFFVHNPRFHLLQVPMCFGTPLIRYRWFTLRGYAGGQISFIVSVDENSNGVSSDNVTEVHPGIQGGMQLMIWRITIDVRYLHDFRKVIHARSDSTLRGWEILFGIAL